MEQWMPGHLFSNISSRRYIAEIEQTTLIDRTGGKQIRHYWQENNLLEDRGSKQVQSELCKYKNTFKRAVQIQLKTEKKHIQMGVVNIRIKTNCLFGAVRWREMSYTWRQYYNNDCCTLGGIFIETSRIQLLTSMQHYS